MIIFVLCFLSLMFGIIIGVAFMCILILSGRISYYESQINEDDNDEKFI